MFFSVGRKSRSRGYRFIAVVLSFLLVFQMGLPLAQAATANSTETSAGRPLPLPEYPQAQEVFSKQEVDIPIELLSAPVLEEETGLVADVYGNQGDHQAASQTEFFQKEQELELIVGFRQRFSGGTSVKTMDAPGDYTTFPKEGIGPARLIKVAASTDVSVMMETIRQDPDVEYVEPNYKLQTQGIPDDTRFSEQWSMTEISAIEAWDRAYELIDATGGSPQPVTVAVIDTGVDMDHEDLVGRVLPGYNMITGAVDSRNTDDNSVSGHGTHVAGVIAAVYDNGLGIASVTGGFPVQILPIKVLDAAGIGTMYDVAQGIYKAVEQGADIINLSLGARLPDYPLTLADAVKYALDRGVLVVAAAGNEGDDYEGFYPASLPGVTAVEASGQDHDLAAFSNSGVYFTAPGVDILSTLPNDSYGTMSGTSQAAAFTSGTAALLLSIFPDKSPAEIDAALVDGQKGYDYLGYYRYDHYVLNSRGAVNELYGGVSLYDDLELISPQDDSRVSGTVELRAVAQNPANVNRVDFVLYKDNEDSIVGRVYGPESSGIYTFQWDTTALDNGVYGLRAKSYNANGSELWSTWYTELTVVNAQQSGLAVQILTPDGQPAAGAWVTVHHLPADVSNETDETIWEDRADMQGRISISGADAPDGNNYLITARGTVPSNFLYYQTVRAPEMVILDATVAQSLTFSGRRVTGEPLANAVVMADLLESSLPASSNVDAVFDAVNGTPLVTLDAQGQAGLTITPGRYNFRLISAEDYYYLVKHNVEISNATESIEFTPSNAEVALIDFLPTEFFQNSALLLRDTGDYYTGFENVAPGSRITLTPGSYDAKIDEVYRDPDYTSTSGEVRDWLWDIDVPEFQAVGGNNYPLSIGLPLTASLDLNDGEPARQGTTAYFDVQFVDKFGNLLSGLYTKVYTPQTASEAGDTAQVIRRYLAGSETVQEEGEAEADIPEIMVYNSSEGDFQIRAQAITRYQNPTLDIYDSSGDVVSENIATYSIGLARWSVPAEQALGTYTAQVELDAGPAGVFSSEQFDFTVHEPLPLIPAPPADLTVTVKDLTELTVMQGARVVLLRQADGVYYPVGDEEVTNNDGQAEFDFAPQPGENYALAIYGRSLHPDNFSLEEDVFILKPLSVTNVPIEVEITPYSPNMNMNRLVLQATNQNGEIFNGRMRYSVFTTDVNGGLGGLQLDEAYNENGFVLWVPDGTYVFQADTAFTYSSPLYHLQKQVTVPAELGAEGTVVIGDDGQARLDIRAPGPDAAYDREYRLGGVAMFNSGMPFATVLYPSYGQPIFATPDDYTTEAVLIHSHYDGYWDYWLQNQQQLEDNGTVTWTVDDTLNSQINVEFPNYGLGDTVRTIHRLEDSLGNRLTAMQLGKEFGSEGNWNGSIAAWRMPDGSLRLTGIDPDEKSAKIQNHDEVAPFLTIFDPESNEVLRYKNAGVNFDELEYWAPGGGFGGYGASTGSMAAAEAVFPAHSDSTFFGGQYIIPEDGLGGTYKAVLELGAGPQGVMMSETTFEVTAAPAAPVLNELQAVTNLHLVVISGTAQPGVEVNVRYDYNGQTTQAGSITAGTDGSFGLEITLPSQGTYTFTADASLNGLTGLEAEPVQMTADWTAPAQPGDIQAEGQDEAHIKVTWQASTGSDVAFYRLFRDDTLLLEVNAGADLEYTDSGLAEETDYVYKVIAVDQAGNTSEPAVIAARTSSQGDLIPPSAPGRVQVFVHKGGRASVVWSAAEDNVAVTGYRIRRSTDGQQQTLVATVDGADTLNYEDSGLAAGTPYIYAVSALDAAENESEPRHSNHFATPPLSISGLDWDVARNMNEMPVLGNTLNLTLEGDSNRQAVVEFVYDTWLDENGASLAEPTTETTSITLVENKDNNGWGTGIYTGKILLIPGIAFLHSLQADMSDGQGHNVRKQVDLSLSVTGSLTVEIGLPEGMADEFLNGARLSVWSDAESSGEVVTIDGSGSYNLSGLAPGDDYKVRLLGGTGDYYGLALKERFDVVVKGGLEQSIAIESGEPASLRLRIVDSQGDGIPKGKVVLSSSESGRILGSQVSDDQGYVFLTRMLSGNDIKVQVEFNQGQTFFGLDEKIVLESGLNNKEVVAERIESGILAGVVTDKEGNAVSDVNITAVQRVEGRVFSNSVRSDKDGNYDMELFDGQARLEISTSRPDLAAQPSGVSVSIPSEYNIQLTETNTSTVTAAIYTKHIGGDWIGPLDMDWRVAVHFNLNVDGRSGYPIRMKGWPGKTVTVGVDGHEGGLPRATEEVVLDENGSATAVFWLKEEGSIIQGQVVSQEGDLLPSFTGKLYKLEEAGQRTRIEYLKGADGILDSKVRDPGSYEFELKTRDLYGFREFAVSQAQVDEQATVDIGSVVLTPTGFFSGRQGNSLHAVPNEAAPGGVISLRATYNNAGQAVQDAYLLLDVPGGTSLVDGSVTLDGQPVEASVTDDVYQVFVGDLSENATGVLKYQVQVDEYITRPLAGVAVRMRFQDNSETVTELIGYIDIKTVNVSLDVPNKINSLDVAVSGSAPSSSTVRLYDENDLLGETIASPVGFWQMDITLTDKGSPHKYWLHAQAVTDSGDIFTSEAGLTSYNKFKPVLTQFSMQQSDGRQVTFNPAEGKAVFPYVVVPNKPFLFELGFNNPDLVSDVKVKMGGTFVLAEQQEDGIYRATMSWPGRDLGNVSVSYKSRTDSDILYQPLPDTEQEMRRRLPSWAQDLQIIPNGEAAGLTTASSGDVNGSFSFVLPQLSNTQINVNMQVNRGLSYTLTAEDIQAAQDTGVDVYGLSYTLQKQSDRTIILVQAYIPDSILDGADPANTAAAMLAGAINGRPLPGTEQSEGVVGAASAATVAKVITRLEAMNNWIDLANNVQGAWENMDTYQKMDAMMDAAADCGLNMSGRFSKLNDDILAAEVTNAALTGAAIAAGWFSMGIGSLVIGAVGVGVSLATDHKIDKDLESIRADIAASDCEDEDEDNDDNNNNDNDWDYDDDVSKPYWIWDPSGYVFETVPFNRLEGVTATALQQDADTGSWSVWDADWFLQENPVLSDSEGRYGWDVPPGMWQVLFQKPGYETAYSDELQVPPPRTEVNVGMVSYMAPAVASVAAAVYGGYIDINFDKYMKASTLTESTVVVSAVYDNDEAQRVTGNVTLKDTVLNPNDAAMLLARTARFVPETTLTVGSSYRVEINQMAQSYAEQPMASDETHVVTIPMVGEVSNVSIVPGNRMLTVSWTDPTEANLASVRVYWRRSSDANFGSPVELAPGVGSYPIEGLADGTLYTIKVTTVDAAGNESDGVVKSASTINNSGGSPSGGGNAVPADPNKLTVTMRQGINRIEAFNNGITMELPAGAFQLGTEVTVRKTKAASPADANLIPVSPVFMVDSGGTQPQQPVTMTIAYSEPLLAGIDVRKLGLYRQNDVNPDQWDYMGGVVDSDASTVSAQLTHFSNFTVMANNKSFADVAAHWAKDSVEILASRHIVNGIDADSFAPDRAVTRAELAKLLVEMVMRDGTNNVGLERPVQGSYRDVPASAWYFPYVETATTLGLAQGYQGSFRPNDQVSRQEMAAMLVRALGTSIAVEEASVGALGYQDAVDVSPWAAGYVKTVTQLNLMQGMDDNMFAPLDQSTRAQAATVILRSMENRGLITAPAALTGKVAISQVEGEHFELEVCTGEKTIRYVLVSASEDVKRQLADALGEEETIVEGVIKDQPNLFMTGPILHVVSVENGQKSTAGG